MRIGINGMPNLAIWHIFQIRWSPKIKVSTFDLKRIGPFDREVQNIDLQKEDPHLEICGREKTTKTEVCKVETQKTLSITGFTNNVLANLN